ncbi:MAG: pilus assembly protein N-terminal domain-containing protein [Planctomycetes bacterium]|nr:pilus assembly protein N-terminal domain-containing protein [Planctomycetota bacterium]MCC7173020.1 pilus assembly protein N-terminal domain-containing protein [Planctomycetota bacterium]
MLSRIVMLGSAVVLNAVVAFAQTPAAPLTVFKGAHVRKAIAKDVVRVAIGDEDVCHVEVLGSRELLLTGKAPGRTSLIVWFDDGSIDEIAIAVTRDLGVLEHALHRIDPDIHVEAAPDRDAVVLTGAVLDLEMSLSAERAAQDYLEAGERGSDRTEAPLVQTSPDPELGDALRVQRSDVEARTKRRVINLLTLERLPQRIEQRLTSALEGIGAHDVHVERVLKGDLKQDADDVFVLTGSVANQIELTRTLHLASTLVLGREPTGADVSVLGDESGAIAGNGNDSSRGRLSFSGSVSRLFGGQASSGRGLDNQVDRNVARASALSVGGGRVLSYLEVRDLPQVRVDIRVFEVNRTDLIRYAPDFAVLLSDFDQGGFNPAGVAGAVQGNAAARVGASGTDVQQVFGFLADGFSSQLQIGGSKGAVDVAFSLLQARGLARSLSSPNLTVLSGERAEFLVGGEIPIPVAFATAFGDSGGGSTNTPGVFNSVEFREFGVQLSVRPLVDGADFITLDVTSQIARPDDALTTLVRDSTGTDPLTTAFQSRALSTSTRLEDGQVLLIGGLTDRKSADDTTRTPWLADLPVLGWLFQRYSMSDQDLELVVMVNPVILRTQDPSVRLWQFPSSDPLADANARSGESP